MTDIDSELINELIQSDQFRNIGKEVPIRRIVGHKIMDYDTEVDIGKNRTADILLTIKVEYEQCTLVIEVENDRKPDFSETLRKIKRGKGYATKVIIPKNFEQFAWRFQKSGIPVWYWTGIFKWRCRDPKCNKITTSTSSLTPIRCEHCQQKGTLEWAGKEKVVFTEADGNPSVDYERPGTQISFGERPR